MYDSAPLPFRIDADRLRSHETVKIRNPAGEVVGSGRVIQSSRKKEHTVLVEFRLRRHVTGNLVSACYGPGLVMRARFVQTEGEPTSLAEALLDWKCPSCGDNPDVDCACNGRNI